jgi:type IV secretion system protein VirB9
MRKILLSACLLLPFSAYALQMPTPTIPTDKGGDPHVQTVVYNPGEEVLVVGAVGRPLTITFGTGEHIRRVVLETASLDKDGKKVIAPWDGPSGDQLSTQPLGNVLPLWAMRAGRSSAQVITGTDTGENRVYQLRLVALARQPDECETTDCDDPRLTTGLTFQYPSEVRAKAQQVAFVSKQEKAKIAAEQRLKTDVFYGVRNWRYVAQGRNIESIIPDDTSDNSQVTGFRYLGNRPTPAFYIVDAGQTLERQITPIAQQDLMVVYESIPACLTFPDTHLCAHFTLRRGDLVANIFNRGSDQTGFNPQTGTTSPNVIRVTRSVKQ